ncbi:hypothetical protein AYO41_03850 [Verrucomicrobia bacterium SCGC AG-212-E04]|nr:hypothetical protein AYO41_03850 [Verrucomicrobia bacterium SCGC AG-212-E04]
MTHSRFLPILALVLALVPTAGAKDRKPPAPPPYSIVMASFPEELAAMKKVLVLDRKGTLKMTKINGVAFESAYVGKRRCLFFLSGMSVANAAMTTQLALSKFPVKEVFFTGIAGGINPAYTPGDVVIPERWAYHSEGALLNEREPGKFQVPSFMKPHYANFHMFFPDDVWVIRAGLPKYEQSATFPADPALIALAKRALVDLRPPTLNGRPCKVNYGGTGVSGMVFCDNASYREYVFSVWKAECLDMESTAIAHVCWANQIPCLIVRGLSDLAGGQAGPNEEEIYLKTAAEHSALVLEQILSTPE